MLLADVNKSCGQGRQHCCCCLPLDWQNNQQPQHHIGVYQLSTIAVTLLSGLLRFCILARLQVIYLLYVTHEKPCFRLPLAAFRNSENKNPHQFALGTQYMIRYLSMFQKFSLFYQMCGSVSKFLPKVAIKKNNLTVQYSGLSIGSIYPLTSLYREETKDLDTM